MKKEPKSQSWRVPKLDISKYGQDNLLTSVEHHQTSFPGPIWQYTTFKEIWNFDQKS